MQYVRSLETRCKQLEDEKRQLLSKLGQICPSDPLVTASGTIGNEDPPLSGRPEAVVRALQVLEVREQLEQGRQVEICTEEPSEQVQQDMDDGEKALVREMCNVSNGLYGPVMV